MRKQVGGMVEAAINAEIDKFKTEELQQLLVSLIVEKLEPELEKLKLKLKANVVDLIDGEDDIPNV